MRTAARSTARVATASTTATVGAASTTATVGAASTTATVLRKGRRRRQCQRCREYEG
jgi:hypothetical protein